MLVQLFRLEEVPATSRRPVVGAAAQNDVSAVLVLKLVRVLPDVAHQIRHCEDGVAGGDVRRDRLRAQEQGAICLHREVALVEVSAPGIEAPVGALGCVLPLPGVWQARAPPGAVGARLAYAEVGHRQVRDCGGGRPSS